MFRPALEMPGQTDLSALPTERLEAEIVEVAGQLAAQTCRWLLLVAEHDRRDAYLGWGFSSTSRWLAFQCSLDRRSAREHVRVARALPDLPAIRAGFGRGELSYSKVRALTRIATPDSEGELLELARETTASQLDDLVRRFHRCSAAEAAFDAHEARRLDAEWDDDGCLRISARLDPEDGAALMRAIEAAETFDRKDSPTPIRERCQRRADALLALAEAFLAGATERRSPGERREVVVHVDAEVLREDGAGRCELEAGPVIAAETARRLSCDSPLVAMLDGPKGPLAVGRSRRTIPPATRRALVSRDGCCHFPGCENRRFVDAHHIRHWAQGGETSLDNLVVLCTHHHRLVHEGGFSVRARGDGSLGFFRPGGREVTPLVSTPTGEVAAPAVTRDGLVPRSRGEELDRDHAMLVMLQRAGPRGPC